MTYTKTGPFTNGAAPAIDAPFFNNVETELAAAAATVRPESFVHTGDSGDWALAITRALAYATPLGLPVQLQAVYPTATTVTLNSGDTLTGLGPATGIRTPTNAPIVALTATGKTGITLQNFLVDGNCVTLASKSYTRSIRFISCTSIRLHQMTTQYTPDWATSFEACTNVLVTDHVHRAGDATLTGGRDGIHFLDCSDVLLDGARIHSGDDCVGITSQTAGINRITIRNVTGVSETAAVVTLGNEATTSFNATEIRVENISAYQSPDYPSTNTQYVVKLRAQNAAYVRNVRVSGISGAAVQYGVWLDGNSTTSDSMADVIVEDVNVTSSTMHGIYFNYVTHFTASAMWARALAGAYDGIHVENSKFGAVIGGSARSCALWGLQVLTCTTIDVVSFYARDNGGSSFASSTGGNGAIVNSSDVQVLGGVFVGGSSTSYYGLYQSGNTSTVVSTNTRIGGAH